MGLYKTICQDILYKTKYICYINLHREVNIGKTIMYTTTDERGILNNYAYEPKVTYEEYPAVYEQKRYVVRGAIAALLVTATIFISFAVS